MNARCILVVALMLLVGCSKENKTPEEKLVDAIKEAFPEMKQAPEQPTQKINFGDDFKCGKFVVAIVSSEIVALKSSEKEALKITFSLTNTDDRIIREYLFAGSQFVETIFVTDDVNNTFDEIPNEFENLRPVAMGKLQPGQTIKAEMLFEAPPPRTKHLVVHVNAVVFQENGRAEFLIPFENVRR